MHESEQTNTRKHTHTQTNTRTLNYSQSGNKHTFTHTYIYTFDIQHKLPDVCCVEQVIKKTFVFFCTFIIQGYIFRSTIRHSDPLHEPLKRRVGHFTLTVECRHTVLGPDWPCHKLSSALPN
ncbi:unnamed protein product [Arctogadus glacialis]